MEKRRLARFPSFNAVIMRLGKAPTSISHTKAGGAKPPPQTPGATTVTIAARGQISVKSRIRQKNRRSVSLCAL